MGNQGRMGSSRVITRKRIILNEYPDQMPEFYVSVAVDEEPLIWMFPVPDPFVKQFVHIGWLDRFKSLFRREFKVEVSVTGNSTAVLNTKLISKVSRDSFHKVWQAGFKGVGEQFESDSIPTNVEGETVEFPLYGKLHQPSARSDGGDSSPLSGN